MHVLFVVLIFHMQIENTMIMNTSNDFQTNGKYENEKPKQEEKTKAISLIGFIYTL